MAEMTGRDALHRGVRRFRGDVYPAQRERYETAASQPQKPHTLFITCSDSRIDPELLTQSGPGEIFVTRNIGNLVPEYSEPQGAVAAVIEYAVTALGVKQVVVCGHSDCGAMKGLLKRESVAALPAVDRWLQHAEAALSNGKSATLADVTQENVLLQLSHLRTHPAVAGGLADGALELYGWVYDIGGGFVSEYHPETAEFRVID